MKIQQCCHRIEMDSSSASQSVELLDSIREDIDNRIQELREEEGKQSELEDQKDSNLSLVKWSIGANLVAIAVLLAFGFPTVGVLATLLFLGSAGYFCIKPAKSVTILQN